MKTKLKIASLFVMLLLSSGFVFANSNFAKSKEIPFPEYSKSMDLNIDCSASCTFSSCSGNGTCSCSCSWFDCRCYYPIKEELTLLPSMNKKQYDYTKALANLLKDLNDENATKAYNHLSALVSSIKNKNFKSFVTEREAYISSIKNIREQSKKDQINLFFEVIGAEERI